MPAAHDRRRGVGRPEQTRAWRSGRVVASRMPGMAPADPPQAPDRTPDRSILLDRAAEVPAARGLETAVPSEQGAERPAIHAHQAHQHPYRQPVDRGRQASSFAPRRGRLALDHDRDAPGSAATVGRRPPPATTTMIVASSRRPARERHQQGGNLARRGRSLRWRAAADHDDQVAACRQRGTSTAKRLPKPPLPGVPHHGVAHPARDRKAQPHRAILQAIGGGVHDQRPGGRAPAVPVDTREVGRPQQAGRARQARGTRPHHRRLARGSAPPASAARAASDKRAMASASAPSGSTICTSAIRSPRAPLA